MGDPRGKNAEIDVGSEGATELGSTLVLVGRLVKIFPVDRSGISGKLDPTISGPGPVPSIKAE